MHYFAACLCSELIKFFVSCCDHPKDFHDCIYLASTSALVYFSELGLMKEEYCIVYLILHILSSARLYIFPSCCKYSQLAILLLLMSRQMTFTKWRHYSHEKKTGTFIRFYATFAENKFLPFFAYV